MDAPRPSATTPGTALGVLLWTCIWIAILDAALGLVFRLPSDPTVEPRRLQQYFDYGRSVEGKLRHMVRDTEETSAPITRAGWIGDIVRSQEFLRPTQPDKILIAAYGQSFTHHAISRALSIDPRFELRMIGGPAAPLSHSYKAALADSSNHHARVVAIGILASSLAQLTTLSPMAWGFEAPTPYAFPRYRVFNGALHETPAPLNSFDELRDTLAQPERFAQLRDALAQDASFDRWVFDQDLLDHSVVGRLLRRAHGHAHQTDFNARYHTSAGFTNHDGLIDTARALVTSFVRQTRERGRIPLVILFEDRGYEGHLEQVFVPVLEALSAPYVSTRSVAPASDLQSFAPDGHFTPAADTAIAQQVISVLEQSLAAPSAH